MSRVLDHGPVDPALNSVLALDIPLITVLVVVASSQKPDFHGIL